MSSACVRSFSAQGGRVEELREREAETDRERQRQRQTEREREGELELENFILQGLQ